ncbi:MAG: PAS domain S-box protein, partial [Planctomycetes bacterium]|nr:PAS domain S-box protein [Planctomycetota bacterium]
MKDPTKPLEQLLDELKDLDQGSAQERDHAPPGDPEESLWFKGLFFEASLAANSIADREGILTHCNAAFLQTWGYDSEEEVLGRPIAHFLKDEEKIHEIITALNSSDSWEGEYRGIKKDRSVFDAYALATVLYDGEGVKVGYQSSVLDISARKRAENARR